MTVIGYKVKVKGEGGPSNCPHNTVAISFQCDDPLDSFDANPPTGEWKLAHFLMRTHDENAKKYEDKKLFFQVLPPADEVKGYVHHKHKKGKKFWKGKSAKQMEFEKDPFQCRKEEVLVGKKNFRFIISEKEATPKRKHVRVCCMRAKPTYVS